MTQTSGPPRAVFESYALEPESIERLAAGLINETFAVRRIDGSACILQQVNPIFPPEINDDIDAVTRHLSDKGLVTPRLIPTQSGQKCCAFAGGIWRLLTRIDGETVEVLRTNVETREAGRVLGAFHQALADFDEPLLCQRPAVHNLDRHIAILRTAIGEHTQHAAHRAVTRLARNILSLASRVKPLPKAPLRLLHGDPKISNVIFDGAQAVCLVDLDTIARAPVAIELGDALRSWCNPAGEESPEAHFLIDRFRAALEGYLRGAPGLLTVSEWRAVPNATLAITTELAARFAADALRESYFSWNPDRFESASQHNLARAGSQLVLAIDIERNLRAMREEIVTLA